jgi:hypothetical protein
LGMQGACSDKGWLGRRTHSFAIQDSLAFSIANHTRMADAPSANAGIVQW